MVKKLIAWVVFLIVVVLFYKLCFGADKNVVYEKDTGQIIGIATKIINTNEADRVNIIGENGLLIYGAKTDKIITISVDEKIIPADLTTQAYKIDAIKKEIYQDVILEEKP